MGSQTARGYPYPVGSDRVMDGDDAIHSLASKVDANLGYGVWGKTVTITVPTLNVNTTAVVTFPAGMFAVPPVVATALQGNATNMNTSLTGPPGTASVGVAAVRTAGAVPADIPICVVACGNV